MGNFPRLAWTNLACCERYDSNRFPGKRREFHLITLALSMNQDYRPDIAPYQLMFGQVSGKNYIVEFLNHAQFTVLTRASASVFRRLPVVL